MYILCVQKRMDIAAWFQTTFNLSKGYLFAGLRGLCRDVEMASKEDFDKNGNYCCDQTQQLALVINFIKDYNFEKHDIVAHDNSLLKTALSHGKYKIAKQLVDTFKITRDDFQGGVLPILYYCFTCTNLELLQWFIQTFEISLDEIRAHDDKFFERCLNSIQIHMAEWLAEKYNLLEYQQQLARYKEYKK